MTDNRPDGRARRRLPSVSLEVEGRAQRVTGLADEGADAARLPMLVHRRMSAGVALLRDQPQDGAT